MPTVAGQFETLAQAAIREGHGHVQYLDALLTAEIEERERKGVVRRIQEARLPRVKTLAEFDFKQSSVSAARIADLAAGGYIGRAEPVVLIGEAARPIWRWACAWRRVSSGGGFASPVPRRWSTSLWRPAPPVS
jgi:hypothetical protein